MRICFITHDASLYGASRSLKTLLESFESGEIQFDLIVSGRFSKKMTKQSLSDWFATPADNIYFFDLPFLNEFVGREPSMGLRLTNLKWMLNRHKLYKFLDQQQYDLIYLNSTVLLPVVSHGYNFVLHVREILPEQSIKKYWIPKLEQINKILFIDEATYAPFKAIVPKDHLILNNPFNMKHVQHVKPGEELSKLNSSGKTIFSVIGSIHPNKGIDFIIESFINADLQNALLLIVGTGQAHFVQHCKNLAKKQKNITFWGEEKDISKIYRIADFILRGEAYPCIGRTVFEGLYSDTRIIIQGTPGYYQKVIPEELISSMNFYTPRSMEELSNLLKSVEGFKSKKETFLSNTTMYKQEFINYISNQ